MAAPPLGKKAVKLPEKKKQMRAKAGPLNIKYTGDTQVRRAVDMLMNNRTFSEPPSPLSADERKVGGAPSCAPLSLVGFDAQVLGVARGLFPTGKRYNFELHAYTGVQANGSGVFNTRLSWDASVTTFAEFSALSALFDEVKARRCQVDITSSFGPTSTSIIVMCCIAPDNEGTSGATPAFTVVQRLAESEYFHCYLMAGKPGVFTKVHTIDPDRPWAPVATPGGASGTPSGTIGQFSLASNIATTAGITVLFASIKVVYVFRNRA